MTRFHVTLASAGCPVMHGWWRDEPTARGKFTAWVGRDVTSALVALVDDESGETLDEWPGEG